MDNTYTTYFLIARGMDICMIDMYKLTLFWIVSQNALASGETCDNIRHASSKSQCLTFCSVNATCLSVTYNPTTSTCFTSDKVQVVSIETEHPLPGVFVKSNAESEAEVYGLRYGIAVGESASQSSLWQGTHFPARNAVDGDKVPISGSPIACTAHDEVPTNTWWMVELSTQVMIAGVTVYTHWHTDPSSGWAKSFHDVQMTVRGEDGHWIICNTEEGHLLTNSSRRYPCQEGKTFPNIPNVKIVTETDDATWESKPPFYR